MRVPTKGKRLVALSAAAALSVGGLALAGPANADTDASDTTNASSQAKSSAFSAAAKKAFSQKDVAAVGLGKDGQVIVQTVKSKPNVKKDKAFEQLRDYAEDHVDTKGSDIKVEEIAKPYEAMTKSTDSLDTKSAEAQADEPDTGDFDGTVVAGAGYVTQPEDASEGDKAGLCSVGFPATDSSGNDVLISAGHCAAGMQDNPVYLEKPSTSEANGGAKAALLDGQKFGSWGHVQYGGKDNGEGSQSEADAQDFSVIKTDKSVDYNYAGKVTQWTKKAAAADNLASDAKDITGVHDVTTDDVGEDVYHSGRTTGKKDGKIGDPGIGQTSIVDGYASIEDADGNGHMVYGFGSDTQVDHGDSGGTVMMGNQAVGVVSGGAEKTDGSYSLWTAELHEGLKHLGGDYKIKTGDDDNSSPSPSKTETSTPDPTDTKTSTPDPTDSESSTPEPSDSESSTPEPSETESSTPDPTDTESSTPDPTDSESATPTESSTDEPTETESSTPDPTDTETSTSEPTETSTAPSADVKIKPDSAKIGDDITVSGLKELAGKKVDVVFHSDPKTAANDATVGKDGTVKTKVPNTEAGKHKVIVTSADGKTTYGSTNFTVKKDEASKLSVDPNKISAKNFVNDKKGVNLSVNNVANGNEVKFTVTPKGSDVKPYTYTAKANSKGVANWSVYGTSTSDPSVYVGKYDVKATVANGTNLTGAFQVTSGDPNGGGSDDGDDGDDNGDNGSDNGNGGGNGDDNGNGGGDLPKTGVELGGLAAGAALLLVGGAALVIGRRKRSQS